MPRLVYVDWMNFYPLSSQIHSLCLYSVYILCFVFVYACTSPAIANALPQKLKTKQILIGEYFDEIVYQNYWIGKWCGNMFICNESDAINYSHALSVCVHFIVHFLGIPINWLIWQGPWNAYHLIIYVKISNWRTWNVDYKTKCVINYYPFDICVK